MAPAAKDLQVASAILQGVYLLLTGTGHMEEVSPALW